jgi:hypothetical protein
MLPYVAVKKPWECQDPRSTAPKKEPYFKGDISNLPPYLSQ